MITKTHKKTVTFSRCACNRPGFLHRKSSFKSNRIEKTMMPEKAFEAFPQLRPLTCNRPGFLHRKSSFKSNRIEKTMMPEKAFEALPQLRLIGQASYIVNPVLNQIELKNR